MERADGLDVQRSGLFQQSLHLRAVLAHDVQVVAAGLAGPVGLLVELCHRAEAAKAVGGEEDFFGGLIAHHDLGPVDHRCEHESQGVSASERLSPSFTTTRRSLAMASGPKNCSIYWNVLALPTTCISG